MNTFNYNMKIKFKMCETKRFNIFNILRSSIFIAYYSSS